MKWIPDRKVLAGGIAGVLAFLVATLTGVPVETITPIVAGAMGLAAYFVPASVMDVVTKVDDTVIALAVRSAASPATAEGAARAGTLTANVER